MGDGGPEALWGVGFFGADAPGKCAEVLVVFLGFGVRLDTEEFLGGAG